MLVLETDKFIFYTAGKIGTQTLFTIPNISAVSYNITSNTGLRKKNLQLAILQKEITNKQIVAVIREPQSRMYSGLFEIISKIISGPFIQEMIAQRSNLDFLEDSSFWTMMLNRCMKLSPRIWKSDKEFDSYRWQYHVGNWLADVETIAETFSDTIVLDLNNLSDFLKANQIEFYHVNKFSNVLPEHSSGNPDNIFSAFKSAVVSFCKVEGQDYIDQYLQSEISAYNRLLAKSMKF
jgi:hypothetical protein